jgi:hypothetical protein
MILKMVVLVSLMLLIMKLLAKKAGQWMEAMQLVVISSAQKLM